ncbi:UNVERIFIED_CONTAM: hypothetical protein PYX00_011483 [Menopon gallinae]|uniref:Peptidyl-prolyl cis-trans isomerase n=1 Tax=Menopon gallinae TaxID=328185 RepID=A0AAW2H7Q6_9NEOP
MENVQKTAEQLKDKKVFLDISYTPRGKSSPKTERLTITLFADKVPRTCHNFVRFVEGVERNGKTYSYKNNIFHRIIDDFMIQGGDVTHRNGRGGFSVYGERFEDESFDVKHTKAGLLSMANAGKNTNGSQFFITVRATPWLDGKHVVFGEVDASCMCHLNEISKVETNAGDSPRHLVEIVGCGLI